MWHLSPHQQQEPTQEKHRILKNAVAHGLHTHFKIHSKWIWDALSTLGGRKSLLNDMDLQWLTVNNFVWQYKHLWDYSSNSGWIYSACHTCQRNSKNIYCPFVYKLGRHMLSPYKKQGRHNAYTSCWSKCWNIQVLDGFELALEVSRSVDGGIL